MRHGCLFAASISALCVAAGSAQTPTHELRLAPEHVHWGYYDARLKPVLHVASGRSFPRRDDGRGRPAAAALAGVTEAEIPEALKLVEQRVTERGPGAHPMTGPIYIDGAEPGDTLEIRIVGDRVPAQLRRQRVQPGGGVLPDEFPYASSS